MKVELNKHFAADSAADEFDVKQIKKALNRLGYYTPLKTTGITGVPDRAVFDALKVFQVDHGLSVTGIIRPDDETITKLNEKTSEKTKGEYIWRTVGDGNVRASHKALEGTVRDLSDSPNPGEEFNCRCWVDFVPVPKRKPNCKVEEQKYEEAQKNLQKLEERKEKLFEELQKLRTELRQVGDQMVEALGAQLAAFIISIPIDRLGVLAELVKRFFGKFISEELLQKADYLAKRRAVLTRKSENKLDQLKILMIGLRDATEELNEARQAFEECRARIPVKSKSKA